MTRKEEKLVLKIEKAGIKKSLKLGHKLTEEELLELRIQILPTAWRIFIAVVGFVCAVISYFSFQAESDAWGALWAVSAVLFWLFAIFGVRRTLSGILDSLSDAHAGAEIVELALRGIGAVVEGIFDGV
ncbi:hypothetical protein FEM03_22145 [Phragmitibacter flavus]|uniref:Uncharacterized protein n=1 Tax=Phragmitibacter flavus TaxID=2576071 RepID=A0A5R8KAE8_9BACT|nr:hypothetical protein [Phragmitibacter flavus]TLD68509.1 hypothetical protein FEM03_22145 [Phragmitibacter flavus]